MAHSTLTIDRLFDRSARLPYPLRARTSPQRRWCMLSLFVILSTMIGVYWFVTDARRVRNMAEEYLTNISGAEVTVGRATLSIFEGLRLDDVRVFAEPSAKKDPKSIGSLPIFTASRFQITYNLRLMLRGRLEATRIVATNPHVLVAEDLDTGRWNYQKLVDKPAPDLNVTPGQPLQLPEVVLRDARVEYIEVRKGVKSAIGSMSLEGHLSASTLGDRYTFNLQSRGVTQGMGPSVSGSIEIATGKVYAQLRNFTFGRDIKTMLPALVRTWWEQHELSGRVNVPQLVYTPATGDTPANFKVETELDSVALAVHPNEWMSHDEIQHLDYLAGGIELLKASYRNTGMYFGAKNLPTDEMAEVLKMEPIRLQRVSGTFVFTDKGIEIPHAGARIENNAFALSGRIGGYSPDSPLQLKLSSWPTENLVIPAAPQYVASMPQPVRELYLVLKPSGECKLQVEVRRDEPGDRIGAAGVIEVVDGQFQFARFPYPVRQAHGKIEFGPDPKTGIERLEITDLRGKGVRGGPNENSVLMLSGRIAPLGPDAAAQIFIRGDRVVYEDILRRSFPPGVQNVLKLFEAKGHEGSLKFEGGFLCEVYRSEGYDRDVIISTDIRLDDAAGVLDAFPYPLSHVKGLVQIRDDHVDLVNVNAVQGDMKMKVEGRVSWKPHHEREGDDPSIIHVPEDVRGDIKLSIVNVPIDEKLMAALPEEPRVVLKKLGLSGLIDIDGALTQRPVPSTQPGEVTTSPMKYDLALKVRNGAVKPPGFDFAVEKIAGDLRISTDRVEVKSLAGVRGNAKVTGSGSLDLTKKDAKMVALVSAENLELDKPFYQLVTKETQVTWDELRPAGTVDIDLGFNQPRHAFTMALRPRELTIQPVKFPLKLDKLTGELRVRDDLVTFDDLKGHSGDATIWIDGTQRMDRLDWNVKLAARDVVLTDELMNAMPAGLKGLFTSISLKGKIAVDFEKLKITARQPAIGAVTPATTQPEESPDIDFSTTVWLSGASMDLGVPIEKADGRLMLSSSIKNGHLSQIDGGIEAWKLTMAGRDVTNFTAKLSKRPDETGLRLDDMKASVAGGTMGGRIDMIAGDNAASKYVMNLTLRNADVAELTQESGDQKIEGKLSASLALEGTWGDASRVRGRGDVVVSGDKIAKLPLLLGLFQIANLALPITGPLNDATVRYSIDGPIVTFDRIDLKGNNVRMSGDGKLDFTKKTVDMRFNTENPTAMKIPFVGPLIQTANKELLQIHVRGSVQSPKVSSSSFGTVSTTVDEVFNGDDNGSEKKK